MFRVVADQLRISEGWVRCGHCAEVFDAQANLQDPESVVTASRPRAASVPVAPTPPEPYLAAAPRTVARSRRWRGPVAQPTAERLPGAVSDNQTNTDSAAREAATSADFIDTPVTHPGALDGLMDDVVPAEQAAERRLLVSPDDAPSASSAPAHKAVVLGPKEPEPAGVSAGSADSSQAEAEPSFLLQAKRQRTRNPWRRAAWGFLSLVLFMGLTLQVLVNQRDRMAAAQPQALALLTPLCELVKCTIGPMREISALRIDSSAFNKIRGDLYRLAFTVSSASDLPLAVPHMELTLTDEQDRVLARRVLNTGDLPGSPGVMSPRGQWSGQWAVSVVSADLDGRVAGYRLLAFYP